MIDCLVCRCRLGISCWVCAEVGAVLGLGDRDVCGKGRFCNNSLIGKAPRFWQMVDLRAAM